MAPPRLLQHHMIEADDDNVSPSPSPEQFGGAIDGGPAGPSP
jgi:hypothetical protein